MQARAEQHTRTAAPELNSRSGARAHQAKNSETRTRYSTGASPRRSEMAHRGEGDGRSCPPPRERSGAPTRFLHRARREAKKETAPGSSCLEASGCRGDAKSHSVFSRRKLSGSPPTRLPLSPPGGKVRACVGPPVPSAHEFPASWWAQAAIVGSRTVNTSLRSVRFYHCIRAAKCRARPTPPLGDRIKQEHRK